MSKEIFGYIGFGNRSYPATKKECLEFCNKYDKKSYMKIVLKEMCEKVLSLNVRNKYNKCELIGGYKYYDN